MSSGLGYPLALLSFNTEKLLNATSNNMTPSYPVLLIAAVKTLTQMKGIIAMLTEQKVAWDKKEAAYSKIKESWRQEARKYALDSDYWRRRSENAEAAIVWLMRNCVSGDAKIDKAHAPAIRAALLTTTKLLDL